MIDNQQLIHIGSELVLFAGLGYYMNKKFTELTKANQELQETKDELEERVEVLEKKIETLYDYVMNISSYLEAQKENSQSGKPQTKKSNKTNKVSTSQQHQPQASKPIQLPLNKQPVIEQIVSEPENQTEEENYDAPDENNYSTDESYEISDEDLDKDIEAELAELEKGHCEGGQCEIKFD